MSKNDVKQNNKANDKTEKKGLLSTLIQVEPKPKEKDSKREGKLKPVNQPTQKQTTKKEKQENGLSEEEGLLLRTDSGINLIPKKSKAETKKEEKKFSFSISSIVSLMLLVVLSLGVVFFNIISKQQLKSAKEDLYEKEAYLGSYTDKFLSNEEILERIDLYKAVQENVFSPREVVEYVLGIVERERTIEIRSFNLTDNLEFEMSGGAPELAAVAKLWYLLGIDENIVVINLSSVGKGETGVNFSFEGQLETDKFINN